MSSNREKWEQRRKELKENKKSELKNKGIDLDNQKLHTFLKDLHLSSNVSLSFKYGQSGQW